MEETTCDSCGALVDASSLLCPSCLALARSNKSRWPAPSEALTQALKLLNEKTIVVMLAESEYNLAPLIEFQRYHQKVRLMKRKSLKRIDEKFQVLANGVIELQHAWRSVVTIAAAESMPQEALCALNGGYLMAVTKQSEYLEAHSDAEVMEAADSRSQLNQQG